METAIWNDKKIYIISWLPSKKVVVVVVVVIVEVIVVGEGGDKVLKINNIFI